MNIYLFILNWFLFFNCSWHALLYQFQACRIVIRHFCAIQTGLPRKCSARLAPYMAIMHERCKRDSWTTLYTSLKQVFVLCTAWPDADSLGWCDSPGPFPVPQECHRHKCQHEDHLMISFVGASANPICVCIGSRICVAHKLHKFSPRHSTVA